MYHLTVFVLVAQIAISAYSWSITKTRFRVDVMILECEWSLKVSLSSTQKQVR